MLKVKNLFTMGLLTAAVGLFVPACEDETPDPEPTGYSITLTGGTVTLKSDGSNIPSGAEVIYENDDVVIELTATPPADSVFDRWTVSPSTYASRFVDAEDPTTEFRMPPANVTIKATYKAGDVLPQGYSITTNGGTMEWWEDPVADPDAANTSVLNNGDTLYKGDVVIILSAEAPEDSVFLRWDVEPASAVSEFNDRYDERTTFSMPASDVVITAVFKAVGEPTGYTISTIGGLMWWVEEEDPSKIDEDYIKELVSSQPLPNGSPLYEDDLVIIVVTADPPEEGQVFDKWIVTPASAVDNFMLDVTDPVNLFVMPAADVTITATFKDEVTYSANVKFTWESAEQAAIWSISASETDVAYWRENNYDPTTLANGDELPLYAGSPELPDNIYSKTLGVTTNKGLYHPLEAGSYTAVASIEDEEFTDAYWDIVANYTVESDDAADTYFEIFFDVGAFFFDDPENPTGEYWKFFDRSDDPTEEYLSKARANKFALKIGTKKFKNGEVTYYLVHRQKKA